MKKTVKTLFLLAIAIGTLSVSCKKNDTPTNQDPNYNTKEARTIAEWVKEGVEVDMQSHAIELNVKADGSWSAVTDSDDKWLALNDMVMTYSGSRQLLLCIDENRNGADRKSTLYVEDSKGDIFEIPVRQNYNFNGEAPDNGSGLAFSNNGVGFGVDYDYVLDTKSIARRNALEDAKIANKEMTESERTQFSPTKVKKNNPIFNINRIERLMSKEGDYKLGPQAYVETKIPYTDLSMQLMDSTVSQAKHLDVALELGVSFGCIEFVAAATYASDATEDRTKLDYTIIRNAPIYNVTISEAEIASYAENSLYEYEANYKAGLQEIQKYIQSCYEKNGREELTKLQQKMLNGKYAKLECPNFDGVFSASFGDLYWEYFAAIAEEDEAKIEGALTKIDNYIGPFYISGGDFGGAMTIYAKIDNLTMDGYVEAGGNLDADIAGAFKVHGEFNYSERGMTLLRNCQARFYIYGGDNNKATNTMTALLLGDDAADRNAWTEAISDWIEGMYQNDEVNMSMAAPISFVITPVWNLFWDADMQKTAQDWFLKKYEDRGILDYFGIMTGKDIGAEQIMFNAQKAIENEG